MLIYKIFRPAEWNALRSDGQTLGAPIDLSDGYIHFSTANQLGETLSKHFAGVPDLVLAACETDSLGAELEWEPSRDDDLFPHLYRPLKLSDFIWHKTLAISGGSHVLPPAVE